MADYLIKGETLTGIADAIRRKTGSTEDIKAKDMESTIDSISTGTDTSDATVTADEIFAGETAYGANGKVTGTFTIENELTEQDNLISQITTLVNQKANPEGGTDTSDATATAEDILSGKTAYVNGEKVTGTIATKTASNLTANGATVTVPAGYYDSRITRAVSIATQATPSISVSSSGLITASATQSAGYVASGTKSGTKQLTTKTATTYTPTTSNQTIASGTYLTGTQTIKGDANLKAENIVSGVSIFGVTGTATTGGSGGGSVETYTGSLVGNFLEQATVYYVDKNYTIQTIMTPIAGEDAKTIEVIKNSLIFAKNGASLEATAGCTRVGGTHGHYCFQITANNFILTTNL